ncbi:hypothetical protein HYW74_04020 [Candidatus Pacearchaeota archaeon]|nr:hypothetical protein [Candidatus Pacearchaeota archaeon]
MSKKELLSRLNQEQEHFIEVMHPVFGIEKRPDTIPIILENHLEMWGKKTTGTINIDEMRIKLSKNGSHPETYLQTLFHEGGHYLHYLVQPDALEFMYFHTNLVCFCESIAELAAISFLLETRREQIIKLSDTEYCRNIQENYMNIPSSVCKSRLKEIIYTDINNMNLEEIMSMVLPRHLPKLEEFTR